MRAAAGPAGGNGNSLPATAPLPLARGAEPAESRHPPRAWGPARGGIRAPKAGEAQSRRAFSQAEVDGSSAGVRVDPGRAFLQLVSEGSHSPKVGGEAAARRDVRWDVLPVFWRGAQAAHAQRSRLAEIH